jgi:hypothetical protein
MVFYSVKLNNSQLNILAEEEEMSTKRLKNHILRHLDKVNYDNLHLYIQSDESVFHLDENELVDCDQEFVLEIDN